MSIIDEAAVGRLRHAPVDWRYKGLPPDASTVDEIIAEVSASRLTERGATRADDRISEAAMEDRKREGYF